MTNATQRNATQRNATQRNATQRNATQKNSLILLCTGCLFSTAVFADLPLTVEDLITAPNKWRLDMGMSYVNQERRDLQQGGFFLVDLDAGRSIAIPLPSTQGQSNTDTLIVSPALRYGVTSKLEASLRGSGTLQQSRFQSSTNAQGAGFSSQTETRWNDVWLGSQYQIFNNHAKYPNLLAFADLALLQRGKGFQPAYAQSGLVGLTTYTVNDPLVFSLTSSYQVSGSRQLDDGRKLQQGDVWSLSGSLGFAVNPEVTLTSGLSWRQQQAERLEGTAVSLRRTQTSASVGFAYALSERSNLSFNVANPISGEGGSTLALQVNRKLGVLPDSRVSAIRERARQRVAQQQAVAETKIPNAGTASETPKASEISKAPESP